MKLLIAIYFFILATIQLGLLLGIYHYYRTQNTLRPSSYWMGSLAINILALIIFGGGIVGIGDVEKPEFNFTIANSLFYIAAILQLLFCSSLNAEISKNLKHLLIFSVIIFVPAFELMRLYGSFEMRTAFLCIMSSIFFVWQILQLNTKRASDPSKQLTYVQYATSAELMFALGRIIALIASGLTIKQVEQIPQLLIFLTVAQMVMNTLSYIALGGYWAEKIALANLKSETENQKIKVLLQEREGLIANLLRANKTAATGALSASIAHELNQPLGATHLNIQFLQKKLSEGVLTPEQNNEVLLALLSDNQRAANIIQSLRSIFSDGKIGAIGVDINDLIESVLRITKPEIHSKNIQVVLELRARSLININSGEIQQVLLNLMNNAIQALSRSAIISKELKIESRNVAEGVEILVADNGPGIDAESQSHLFELLAGGNNKAGMGLGLWLCQHIIARHGGRIWYETLPQGGAQFVAFLPFAQE
ncbi:sensor histidine kinase [Polynucleobacter sp. AP-Nino-20-G2]|uniref:sensor histidine kinase n=1 Tax=Polynucleobacter sp. AP-Nino-20-G2 TaxID=2576917 RepID=UPI001BFD1B51|nr:HAMP domain-containing sensor histidine kinase [Polynucleobacter sp. AP-Nino-20-G2]QWE17363.1 HAMP domain-containing histidine kinase [Polynucleobacter sp. AP-Nino-20-G2]